MSQFITAIVSGIVGIILSFCLSTLRTEISCRKVAQAILRGIRDEVNMGVRILRRIQSGNVADCEAPVLPNAFWVAHSHKLSGRVLEVTICAAEKVSQREGITFALDFLTHVTWYYSIVSPGRTANYSETDKDANKPLTSHVEEASQLAKTLTEIVDELSSSPIGSFFSFFHPFH